MERLSMEGMSIKDVTAVRVPFGEMPTMLARGDIDAYVGAEPGPALSITSGQLASSSNIPIRRRWAGST